MCRKPKHESLTAFSRLRRAGLALGVLVLLFGLACEAEAQKTTGSSTTAGQSDVRQDTAVSITQFVPVGYSIEGPLTVYAATTEAISFFIGSDKKFLVLELKGTRVSYKDAQNNDLSVKALTKGVTVYVSRSPDKKTVIVFVMPSTGKEKRNDV
jgi:hypothetical protein